MTVVMVLTMVMKPCIDWRLNLRIRNRKGPRGRDIIVYEGLIIRKCQELQFPCASTLMIKEIQSHLLLSNSIQMAASTLATVGRVVERRHHLWSPDHILRGVAANLLRLSLLNSFGVAASAHVKSVVPRMLFVSLGMRFPRTGKVCRS